MIRNIVQWLRMVWAKNKQFLFKPQGFGGYLYIAQLSLTWLLHFCAQRLLKSAKILKSYPHTFMIRLLKKSTGLYLHNKTSFVGIFHLFHIPTISDTEIVNIIFPVCWEINSQKSDWHGQTTSLGHDTTRIRIHIFQLFFKYLKKKKHTFYYILMPH